VRAFLLVVAAAAGLALPGAAAAQDRCTGARDLMASSLGRVDTAATDESLRETMDALRRVTQMCPGLGDAYYYLSLIGERLKDQRTEGWRRQASLLGSEAMKSNASVSAGAGPTAGGANNGTAPAATQVSPYVRRKLALVVGVATFKDPAINQLRYTTADGRAFASALKESGFDSVTTLFDSDATTYRIKTEIDQLARAAAADDLVVIYFASHGSPDELDTAGLNYIVTYDTEVSNLYATAYRMEDLANDIGGRIKSERVIAFLDTCYSGGTFRQLPKGWEASSRSVSTIKGLTAGDLQARIKGTARSIVLKSDEPVSTTRMAQGVGRVIITASGQSERSWEDEKIQHGYFTYYLLEAMKSSSSGSIEDMYAQVRVKVPQAVRDEQKQSQNPTIARDRPRVDIHLRDLLQPGQAPAASRPPSR
jgi:uncharacterized caspase-like protein